MGRRSRRGARRLTTTRRRLRTAGCRRSFCPMACDARTRCITIMPRIPLLDFSDRDISRVFLARSVVEAERLEALLSGEAIDYAIELEPFVTGLSAREQTGV